MDYSSEHIARSLTAFFVCTFAATWAIWFTTIADQNDWISFHIPQALAFWLGLFVVTYAVAFAVGGTSAARDLVDRATRWRVGALPYGLAIATPLVIAAVAYLLGRTIGSAASIGSELHPAGIPALLLVSLWLFLMTEETAWRGFALPRIEALTGDPLRSGIALGVVWALWHIPLFFVHDSFQSKLPFIGFTISTIATSVFVTWLFELADGSVLVCAIFHAATDVTLLYFDVMSEPRAFWVTAMLQVIAGIVAGYGLSRARPARSRGLDSRDLGSAI